MTIPELSLLAFAAWTIIVPLGAIAWYRLSRVVTGRASINAFPADAVTGADWYRRAMRAHANCVENLPVFGTIVVLISLRGVESRWQDALALAVFAARVAQSTTHIGWAETVRAVSVRFAAFLIQVLCMLALTANLLATRKEISMSHSLDPRAERTPAAPVDLAAIKARQQAMWSSGDFAVIGTTLQIVGELLCEAVDLAAGSLVVDIACGSGNAALAAARRWCQVTGLDYVPDLLRRASGRAAANGLAIDFVEGDAEHLPFDDGHFDVALSTFGIMFAPDHEQAASEVMRVVKPGGTIGMANWTPDGFIGGLLTTVGKHVPPPAGVASPVEWGRETRLHELFRGVRSIRTTRKEFVFRYTSVAHFINVFRQYYGPTYKAFGGLNLEGQARLAVDIADLASRFNRRPGSFVVPGEYLEVVIER